MLEIVTCGGFWREWVGSPGRNNAAGVNCCVERCACALRCGMAQDGPVTIQNAITQAAIAIQNAITQAAPGTGEDGAEDVRCWQYVDRRSRFEPACDVGEQ